MKTKAEQKQKGDYHIACQNCGVMNKPLQLIPFRNNDKVTGMVISCDNCRNILYGAKWGIIKPTTPSEIIDEIISEDEIERMYNSWIRGRQGLGQKKGFMAGAKAIMRKLTKD